MIMEIPLGYQPFIWGMILCIRLWQLNVFLGCKREKHRARHLKLTLVLPVPMIKENVKMTFDQGQNKSICLEIEAVLKIHTVQQHQVHLVIQEKESEMSPADRANRSIYSFQYFKRYFKIHFMIR